jgi:hypothetical protein
MYKETIPEQVQQGTVPTMAFRQYIVRNSKQADKNTAEATDCSANTTTELGIGIMKNGCT